MSPSSPRQQLLARSNQLAQVLARDFPALPAPTGLAWALHEHEEMLQLPVLEKLIEVMKAEVLRLHRAADRHANSTQTGRPASYRSPKIPAPWGKLADVEDASLPLSTQSQENAEGAAYALEVACCVYLHQVTAQAGAQEATSHIEQAMVLTVGGGAPALVVRPPAGMSAEDAGQQCARAAEHVRKFGRQGQLSVRLYATELARAGFRQITTAVDFLEV